MVTDPLAARSPTSRTQAATSCSSRWPTALRLRPTSSPTARGTWSRAGGTRTTRPRTRARHLCDRRHLLERRGHRGHRPSRCERRTALGDRDHADHDVQRPELRRLDGQRHRARPEPRLQPVGLRTGASQTLDTTPTSSSCPRSSATDRFPTTARARRSRQNPSESAYPMRDGLNLMPSIAMNALAGTTVPQLGEVIVAARPTRVRAPRTRPTTTASSSPPTTPTATRSPPPTRPTTPRRAPTTSSTRCCRAPTRRAPRPPTPTIPPASC